ncbi:hypothetical protein IQ268_08975 [Oculatella sp. LEGE 06141]|uniref:hypothetical protein n=1 Tax=Oculatella sp. LEGE 06141 TaxID=1828648 RepID=UPI0018820769|nr:hypothetical protein [Oculatella sp. LEGE 06141]MBE9178691.1 hypothetical protein [Oculatella sp. LEGE 06141]
MNEELSPQESEQLQRLVEFVDNQPDLSEDELLDQMEQQFPRRVIDAFTGAMTGFAPPETAS